MKPDWQRYILYITLLGIEGCALYALMNLINTHATDGSLFVPGFLMLYPAAFGINLLIKRLRWHIAWRQIISWLVCAGAILLMVKAQLLAGSALSDTAWLQAIAQAAARLPYSLEPALLILLGGILLWWLGSRLAYIKVDFTVTVGEFQFGLVALLLILFIASQAESPLPDAVPTLIAFFIFSLLGMSLTHAREGTSWLSGFYRGHWSGLLALSISIIIIIGLLISVVVTPDFLQIFLNALEWIWQQILKLIAFLASLLPESEPAELPPGAPGMPEGDPSEGVKLWTIPEPLRSGMRLGWTVMIIVIIFLALWRILSQVFSWLRRRLASMAGAEVEHLPGTFRIDFFNWLKHLILKLFRIKLPAPLARKARGSFPDIPPVRQIYCQLLHWATTAGFPRNSAQTPDEYLDTLVALIPEAAGDLDFVTRQYVMARYGTYSPSEDELYQLRDSWQRIQQNRFKNIKNEQG